MNLHPIKSLIYIKGRAAKKVFNQKWASEKALSQYANQVWNQIMPIRNRLLDG